jgi:hypothetical protein
LYRPVDRLGDDEATAAPELLRARLGEEPEDWPAAFFGMLHSDRPTSPPEGSGILGVGRRRVPRVSRTRV